MALPFANLERGKVYKHHDNGEQYLVLDDMHGTTNAVLQTVPVRHRAWGTWTFTANDVYWHEDGTISWWYSKDGRFEDYRGE